MTDGRRIPAWAAVVAGWLSACLAAVALAPDRCALWPPAVPGRPAGVDLAMMLDYSRNWLDTGNPFLGLNPYPPLAAALFAPLARLPFGAAYALLTAGTLAAFASVVAVLPLLAFPRAARAAVLPVALTGVLSYGLWFELRWGQFNVLALACAAWGLYLFHRGRGRGARIAAYVLFGAGIQLKLYPAIFVFLFAQDARAWRANLARWAALGAANGALLFACGPAAFADFWHSLRAQAAAPFVWAGNHSIQSFAAWAGRPEWTVPLFVLFIAAFALALARAARAPGAVAFAGLALVSTLGALLLPGVSHDYKLALLPPAFAFYVAAGAGSASPSGGRAGARPAALWALSALEAWTLFSPAAKPAGAQNAAPFLLAAVVAASRPGWSAGRARIEDKP